MSQTFKHELFLPQARDKVFAFFCDAANLQAITPAWLHFRIESPQPIHMRPGARIQYRLRLWGVPVHWVSEITEWNPPHGFVDEQVKGPYRRWAHRHTFEEAAGGTLCRDEVEYEPRGGALVHRFYVRPQVERIFAHRSAVLRALFP